MTEIRALTIVDLSQVQTLADASQREGFRFVQRFADDMTALTLDSPNSVVSRRVRRGSIARDRWGHS